jgi:radical SAM superfamily enzyme YgiQ (UPF0313 family)
MKSVLLINPWIFDFAAYDFWIRPLGLLYVAAVLRESADVDLRLIDCLDRSHPALGTLPGRKADGRGHYPKVEVPKPAVLESVPRRYSRYGLPLEVFERELDLVPAPDMVLVTCAMTYWYPGVQLAVDLVRRKFGAVPVVLGGAYATLAEDHARRHSGADVVVAGPGENRIPALARDILGDRAVPRTASYAAFPDLPRPAFDLMRDASCLPLLTSRGCPFSCAFCASSLLSGRFEQRPPESVAAEIEDHAVRFGTRDFVFYDDALLLRKAEHIVPILEATARLGRPVSFHAPNGLHIREIDPAIARLFRRAGVRSLYLSQESMDEEVLRDACPKVAPGDLARAMCCLEEAGYARADINVYLIAGLPGQDAASVLESVRRVKALGARPRIAYFSPIPGTRAWQALAEKGRIVPDADPLITNKSAYRFLGEGLSSEDYGELQDLLSGGRGPGLRQGIHFRRTRPCN